MDKLSRRSFLKRTGATAGAVALGSQALVESATATSKPSPPDVSGSAWDSWLAPDHFNWLHVDENQTKRDGALVVELRRAWQYEGQTGDIQLYQRRRPHMSTYNKRPEPMLIWSIVKYS